MAGKGTESKAVDAGDAAVPGASESWGAKPGTEPDGRDRGGIRDEQGTMFVAVCRVAHLAWATLKFGVKFFGWRRLRRAAGPQYVQEYIEECGGLFLKVGQLLAVRLDVIPREYEEKLREFLAQKNPERIWYDDIGTVRQRVEEQLGKALDDVFEDFGEKPVAWASIAQVHKAKLKGTKGDEVAVKVMRNGVKQAVGTDLRFLRGLAVVLNAIGLFRSYGLRDFVDQLCRLTQRELNFVTEASYIEELRSLMTADAVAHYAPKVHAEYSREEVLVMEWLEGVWVSDMLDAVEANEKKEKGSETEREKAAKQLKEWEAKGITPERTARLIFRSLIEQSCGYRIFHADPHPGNLIVSEDGKGTLQYVDFGLVGHLDEFAWEKLRTLFTSMAFHRTHGTYEALIATVEPLPPINTKSLESEIKLAVADWLTASKGQSGRMEEKSNGRLLMRAVDAMRRNRIRFPWAIMALFRATIVSDLTVYRLDPKFDATRELRDFFRARQWRRLQRVVSLPVWQRTACAMIDSAGNLSETIDEVSSWTRTRLPRVGRSYGQGMTRLESGLTLGLGYAKVLLGLGGVVLLGWGVASRILPEPEAGPGFGAFPWLPVGIACLILGMMAGRISRRMEQPL